MMYFKGFVHFVGCLPGVALLVCKGISYKQKEFQIFCDTFQAEVNFDPV